MTPTVKSKPVLLKRETRPRPGLRLSPGLRIKTRQQEIKSILVPIDFSETSKAALRYAVRIAQDYGAEIFLVHVVEPEYYNRLSDIVLSKSTLTFVESATSRLAKLAREEVPSSIAVRPWVQVGSPFEEIASAAKILNADWIIIATHGYSGFRHALLGSTAERVVRHAPCPVLVVRTSELQKEKEAL